MRYDLEYLPIAKKDLRNAAMYIAHDLQAPMAAANLMRKIRKKADALRKTPYMYREYYGEPDSETAYRAMPVNNYLVFYVVNEDNTTVEVHRVLYVRMDIDTLLKR